MTNSNLSPISHHLTTTARNDLSSKVSDYHRIWQGVCHFLCLLVLW